MEPTTYTAVCERAGRWWAIRVPQVEGLTAQAKTLGQAEMMTRQSVARALGVPPEAIQVEVVPEAPSPVAQALQARHAARQALEAAVQETVAALEALAEAGYQFDDAATMLGLSPTEIAQYSARLGVTRDETSVAPPAAASAPGPATGTGSGTGTGRVTDPDAWDRPVGGFSVPSWVSGPIQMAAK
jgi:hypothetical protein